MLRLRPALHTRTTRPTRPLARAAQTRLASSAIEATDANLADVLKQNKRVLLDCYANWCAPCRFLAPILEQEVAASGGKVVLVKVDVDTNPAISEQFRVEALPTVLSIHNGKVVSSFVGLHKADYVRQVVEDLAKLAD